MPESSPTAAPGSLANSPLAVPIFRRVWIASIVSNFGGLIQSVGASWMMTSLSSSPTMVALVQTSTTLPLMMLSLWAGAIADNLDRRLVMLAAQAFMLLVSLGLAFCTWAGWLSPWILLGFTFLIGVGTALNSPAWQSSVGDMVPRAALPGAVALNSMGFNIARSTGPALGGIIVAAAGAAAAFLANAVSSIGLIVVLWRWRPEYPPRLLPPERILTAMGAGIRYAAMSPNIRTVMMRSLFFGLAASAVPALMPLVARDHVTGGPLTYGLLLGAFGIGAVAGGLASRRLRARLSNEWLVRIGTVAIALGAAVIGISHSVPVTMLALFGAGVGWILALSTFNITTQLAAPRWVVGRALALYQMFVFGGMAVGAWLFGAIADVHGVGVAMLAAAAAQLAGGVLGFIDPLPQVEDLNLDLLSRWTEPDTAVPIEPRSGPIVVTIEYRIAQDDILAFLTEMNERRRIRLRDGARHWTLLRDLGEADLWVERYHVPTWLDYVRHNQRRTHEDAANFERIQELHKGPDNPRVHRMIERQTGSLPIGRGATSRELGDPMTDPTRSS